MRTSPSTSTRRWVAVLVGALALMTIAAAPPTVPFDVTGDLIVPDDGCECLLAIDPDGNVEVLLTEERIYTATEEEDVDLQDVSVAVDGDGNIWFTERQSGGLLRLDRDGVLTLVSTDAQGDAAGGQESTGIGIAPDGTIYLMRKADESLIRVRSEASETLEEGEPGAAALINDGWSFGALVTIDPATGEATLVLDDEDLEQLPGVTHAALQEGIAVDEAGNVYVSSNGAPKAVFKVAPDGTPSVLSVGPGTDTATLRNEVVTLFVGDEQVLTPSAEGNGVIQEGWSFRIGVGFENEPFPADMTGEIAPGDTATDVKAAFEDVSFIDTVTVTGAGTPADPWIIEVTDPAGTNLAFFPGYDYLQQAAAPDEGPDTAAIIVPTTRNYYFPNTQDGDFRPPFDHVEAVGTDADSGDVCVRMELEASVQPTVQWMVGDDAATVEAALEALEAFEADDVSVTGSGTLDDPWLITFSGRWSGSDIDMSDSFCSSVKVLVSQVADADAFDDLDVVMTRRGDGVLVTSDNWKAQSLYAITPDGATTQLLTEWELSKLVGERTINLEGGVAYDGQGQLYVGDAADDRRKMVLAEGFALDGGPGTVEPAIDAPPTSTSILRFADGEGEVWVSASDISDVTGETPSFNGQFAFRFAEADLSVDKTGPATAVAGERVTYDITISSDAESRDRVTSFSFDDVTDGLTDVVIEVDQGSHAEGIWTVELAPGESVTATVTGTIDPSATGEFTNTATYTPRGGHIDPVEENNSDTHTLDLTQEADLAITKSGPATIALGEEATYDIEVTNNGPSDAADVTVTDDLPTGLRLVAATGDGFTCSNDAGSVTCTRGSLSPGTSASLSLTVLTELMCSGPTEDEVTCAATDDGPAIDTFDNTVTVASSTDDPDPSNNAASSSADLDIEDPSQFVLADDAEALPAAGLDRGALLPLGTAFLLVGWLLLAVTDPRRQGQLAVVALYLDSRRLIP